MDYKLELVCVPVSDVDRAKTFHTERAGFHADHDHTVSEEPALRAAHPPAPAAPSAIGKGLTTAAPGSIKGYSSSFRTSRSRARSCSVAA